MFKTRSSQKEFLDDTNSNRQDLKQNLNEMQKANYYFGSQNVLRNTLNIIYEKRKPFFKSHTISVADLGCGNGDLLREIEHWEHAHNLKLSLIGFDVNPFIIQYAKECTSPDFHIEYVTENILSPEFSVRKFDIVMLNSVTHHFDDQTLIKLFSQLVKQTKIAIIINDLERHWLSYYTIKWLTKILNASWLIKNDGPLSILRAFKKNELIRLLEMAHIDHYQIKRKWAFRLQLIIWCSE